MSGGAAKRAVAVRVAGTGTRGGETSVAAAAANRPVTSVVSSNSSGQPMPRLVFGGAPSIQKAIQATSQLNNALQRTYLGTETAVTHSAPNSTLQALRLVHKDPAAQNLVATLVSDPNVWDAVTQNHTFNDLFQTCQTRVALPTLNDSHVSYEIPNPEATRNAEDGRNGFVVRMLEVIVNQLAVAMEKLMNHLSEYFQSWFGGLATKEVRGGLNGDETFEVAVGPILIKLVIMVIMIILG